MQFNTIVLPLIEKKMIYSASRKEKQGITSKRVLVANFVWVDDRMIEKCMRKQWCIDKPSVGQPVKYGIKEHAFQALALVSYYLALK